ncbi:MAG: hypothetical protein GY873_05415 [Bosea sp.]|nr:hypothetical protein [Bosea sp. (in: a-proteobacteria)]
MQALSCVATMGLSAGGMAGGAETGFCKEAGRGGGSCVLNGCASPLQA